LGTGQLIPMKRLLNSDASRAPRAAQRGSILLETLIAMVVLATGIGGLLVMLVSSMATNNRGGQDTTSVMIAEHVLEQISSQPANAITQLKITDCAGTTWNVSTADAPQGGGNSNAYGGNGAHLTAAGVVDWTQSYTSVPVGYKMHYVGCGAGGQEMVYSVRWDVISMSTYSRMIVVSAKPEGGKIGGLRYVTPISLRTIGGM
jgi:Tfp pilus assembly protein PilV